MRKFFWIIGLVVLFIGVGVVVVVLRPRGDLHPKLRGQGALSPLIEKTEILSLPDISLQINRKHDLSVFQGMPLVFSVRMANPQAMNAAAYNESNQALIEEIQADVASGKILKEEAEAEITRLSKKEEIISVRLGDEQTGLEQFLSFELQLIDGKKQRLPWALKIVAQPEKMITLDEENTVQLDYVLEPSAASRVPVGEYRIVAVVEVPPNAQLPADCWRGRVESEPVKIRIEEKPALLSKTEEERLNIDLARYYFTTRDLKNALEHVDKALLINPKSITAYIIVGDAKEAMGDLEGALAAYQSATREYYQQHPKPYEAPRYLIYKTTSLMEKLNLIQPKKK